MTGAGPEPPVLSGVTGRALRLRAGRPGGPPLPATPEGSAGDPALPEPGASDPGLQEGAASGPAPPEPSAAGPARTSRLLLRPAAAFSLLALTIAAEARAESELFRTLETEIRAGAMAPLGRLSRVLDPSPWAALELRSAYYGSCKARASVAYAFLDGPSSPASVHYGRAAAGLEWQARRPWLPAAGGGLGLHFIRAARVKEGVRTLYLESNESEFGVYAALHWRLPGLGAFAPTAALVWDMIFSRPESIHMAGLSLGGTYGWK